MQEEGIGYSIDSIQLKKRDKKIELANDEAAFIMNANGFCQCIGNDSCRLSVNEYYILPPEDSVTLTNRSDEPCTVWTLIFKKSLVDELEAPDDHLWNSFQQLPRQYMYAGYRSNAIIREILQNILVNQSILYHDTYSRLHVGLAVVICLRTCMMQQKPEKPAVQPPLIMTDIYQYVRSHLSSDLSVNAIAEALHFSPSHLAHLFRKKAGIPIHQYVLIRRLNYSNVLLRQGVSVQKTAIQCGFSSPSVFIRAYKRFFHVTPGKAEPQTPNEE